MDVDNIFPCQIKEYNLSCWGCCGNGFKSKKKIQKQLEENTEEFKKLGSKPSEKELLEFRERKSKVYEKSISPSGLCVNLVDFGGSCKACPLHPMINKLVSKEKYSHPDPSKDLRIGHCDENYECETLFIWNNMPKEQREKYIKWLKDKKFDHFEYSEKNFQGEIIREFLDEMYEVLN